jgi:hypothetical protein
MNTSEQEGYFFVKYINRVEAVFLDTNNENRAEVWVRHIRPHASFGFTYANFYWEFCREYISPY